MTNIRGMVEGLIVGSTMLAMLVSPFARTASAAEGRIRVLSETPLSPAADVPADVRKECNDLGDELPKAIVRANRNVTLVTTPAALQEKTGRYLFIEIVNVKARAAGALSGPKDMTIRGALIDNGKEIADFEAKRGSYAASGTCTMLQKTEKELGAEIGQWLEHPRPHTHFSN